MQKKTPRPILDDVLNNLQSSACLRTADNCKSPVLMSDGTQANTQQDLQEMDSRSCRLMSQYIQMQNDKKNRAMTNRQKQQKISSFLRRSKIFQDRKQLRLGIQRRLQEIYDPVCGQLQHYPQMTSRLIDFERESRQGNSRMSQLDWSVEQQEPIMTPYF